MVSVITIDSFCTENGLNPILIKLDVEGLEAQALLGAKEILRRGKCCIICEWFGGSQAHEKALSFLDQCNYIAADLNTLEPVDLKLHGHANRKILLAPKARWAALKGSTNAIC